jgi:ATP-dependent protease Clp ATPase subunit
MPVPTKGGWGFSDVMYDLPGQQNVKEVVFSEEVVNAGQAPILLYEKAS